MSINTNMDTITVNDVEYDVEREEGGMGVKLTVTLDGEEVFEGLEGWIGYEESGGDFSPREWSNVGTMAISYSGYNLGDEDISKIDFEIECSACNGSGETIGPDNFVGGFLVRPPNCPACEGVGMVDVNPAAYFIKERGARVVIGLFVYEHSGITMSAGPRVGEVLKQDDVRSTSRFVGDDAGWDTSFVGFIYDTPEGVKECIGDNATDQQIEACLRSEVAVYASYLEGDITYYSVTDEETNFHEGCGGYVGDYELCEKECFASMESAIVARLVEGDERAHWAARDTRTQ